MNKYEYFKTVMQPDGSHVYLKKNWVISAFSLILEDPEAYKGDSYAYRIIQSPTGHSFINNMNEVVPVENSKPGQPLFSFEEPVTIDSTWGFGIEGTIETTIGRILVNAICIRGVFGKKIPYFNKMMDVGSVESLIAPRLGGQNADISVQEYSHFIDRLQYIAALSSLCNYSATRKNILPPPGVDAYRKELLKEYEGRLTDPIVLKEFEDKLKAYDEAYLKDDPSNNIFLSGRAKNNGRRKMFLDYGADAQIRPSPTVTPVVQPLEDGWSTKPEEFAANMTSLRAGSFARGMETVNGGVTAKSLLRSLGTFTITEKDCGTRKPFYRTFTASDIDRLVDRYIDDGKKWVRIETLEQARAYIDKPVGLRSPMYCLSPKESYCQFCAGEKLALNPNGLSLAITDVSSVILATFMALMHGKVLSTAHIDYTKHFT